MLSILSSLGGGLMTALPALFLGGSSIAGGLIGGAMSDAQASKTRKWQAEQNQIQRDWLTEMSNTAHQREVDDLRAAGLNPLLSGKYGGASTPSYSGQSATPADVGSIVAKGISGGVENVLSIYNAVNTAKLTRAQASLADANALKAVSDADRNVFRSQQDQKELELEIQKEKRVLEHEREKLDNLSKQLSHSYDVEKRHLIEADIKRREANVKENEYALKKKQHALDVERFKNQVRQERVENIMNGIGSVVGGASNGVGFGLGAGVANRILNGGKNKIGFDTAGSTTARPASRSKSRPVRKSSKIGF